MEKLRANGKAMWKARVTIAVAQKGVKRRGGEQLADAASVKARRRTYPGKWL
jgi:hypothetical protein